MGKSHKANKRRKQKKSSVPSKPKSPRRLLSKPAWLIGAIASIAVVFGIYLLPGDREEPTGRPSPPPVKSEKPSEVPKQLTPEEEIAALKQEEDKLTRMVMNDFGESEGALEIMGNYLSRHGRREEAAEYWQRCLAKDPRRMSVYVSLGTVAMDSGEFEEAVGHFRRAVEIHPTAPNVHEQIGKALFELGRYDEAVKELEAELRMVPRSVVCHFLLGQAYLKLKNYEKSRSHYEKALELSPGYANAAYGLAQVFARIKQADKAAEFQARFRELRDEENKGAYEDRENRAAADLVSARQSTALALMNTEKLYRARRDFAKAEALLKRAIELDADNPKCYEKLGSLYNVTGRLGEALVQVERMSEVDPANPYCYLNIGKLSMRLKQYVKAERAFRNATKVAPKLSVGYRELARLYLTQNANLGRALELAKMAVGMEASAENFFVLSWALDVNRDRAAALKAIKEALRLEPKNPKYRQIHERIKSGN